MTTILDTARAIELSTGKNPLTPRWEATLRLFYGLGLRETDVDSLAASTRRSKPALATLGRTTHCFRELWARVGRRGRKSVAAALCGVHEALFGGHERFLMQGERGLIALISKDTAGSTLIARFAELHAQALGIKTNWSSIGHVRLLELDGCAFALACFPCSATAPRGYAMPVVISDEPAFYAQSLDYVNNDDAVLGAVKPAMAQFPDSKLICISSPLGRGGLFHSNVEANLGDNADPYVLAVEGPTWEWNPEISEARTHEIEKDPRVWAREFAAIPQDAALAAFPADLIERAFLPRPTHPPKKKFMLLDPSSGGLRSADTFSFAVAGWCSNAGDRYIKRSDGSFLKGPHSGGRFENPDWRQEPPFLRLFEVDGIQGGFLGSVTGDEIVSRIATVARAHGVKDVHSDQREQLFLESALKRHGLKLHAHTWTGQSKPEAVEILRRWLNENLLALPDHKQFKQELLSFEEKINPSGQLTYGSRGGHDDYVALLITAAHAELAGLPGSAMVPGYTYARLPDNWINLMPLPY